MTSLPTRLTRTLLLAGALGSMVPGTPGGVSGQNPARGEPEGPGWNSPRAMELMDAARRARQASVDDTTFRSYRARARGFVYFYLDRPDAEDHTLIRADQIALDVFWAAPNLTRQRIVGMRDEERLPTSIRYHLDHLTVVQDDFQDLIRMGDGDEVAAVVHPAAPGAETLYDYRLADSLSLNYVGLPEPVRVYRVQVRPRDLERPGVVGALFLDRRSGAIVRMAFTFTPASYVDPYLDYIRISLDNGLWLGRHWLPYRQEVELRRELPQLDFMAGSIIRGRWEVGEYVFNEPVPAFIAQGPRVTSVPEARRRAFDFREPLYADLEQEGLESSPELEDVRRQAREMAVQHALGGLRPLRLHLGSVSDVVRRNRAEGWAFGLGVTLREGERPLRLLGGYATAAERGWLRGDFSIPLGAATLRASGYWNRLADIGPWAGASGLINTLATLGGRDYTDPWWTHGGGLGVEWRLGTTDRHRLRVEGRVERHESAALNVDGDNTAFRPVLPVDEGTLASASAAWWVPDLGRGLFGGVRAEAGRLDDGFGRVDLHAGWSRTGPAHAVERWIRLDAGVVSGGAPPQRLYLLGGRGTVPGFGYRGAVADRYALARGFVRRSLLDPWVSLRATGAAAWSELGNRSLPGGWAGDVSPGFRGALGVGADLLWDVVQLDVARGLPDGDWTFFVSVSPRLTPWL